MQATLGIEPGSPDETSEPEDWGFPASRAETSSGLGSLTALCPLRDYFKTIRCRGSLGWCQINLCYILRQVSSFLNDKPRICKTSIKSSKKTESKPSWDPIYHEHFTISQRARTITSQSIFSFAYLIFKWRMEIEAAQASSRGCWGCMWGRAGDAASWEHSPVIPELAKRQKLPTETKCVNKIIFPSFSNSYDLLWMQLWLETLRTTSRP